MSGELKITDPPPPEVQTELARLRIALDGGIPPKWLDHNLLVATWNIQYCSNVTKKWTADVTDSPKRDYRSVLYLAEVLSRFERSGATTSLRSALSMSTASGTLSSKEWKISDHFPLWVEFGV